MPSMSLRAISSRNSLEQAPRAPLAAAPGTEKQIDCSDDDCGISDTLIPSRCSASNVRAAMPGTPSMPLPPTVISACPPAAESALTGYWSSVRRAGDLGPRPRRVGERAHEHRQLPPSDRDQRARVQHLRAVVGELGRLAQVQLRDDARVGDDPRIGGQQAGDVLPQRHLARAQRRPSSVAVRSEPPRPSVRDRALPVAVPASSSMRRCR